MSHAAPGAASTTSVGDADADATPQRPRGGVATAPMAVTTTAADGVHTTQVVLTPEPLDVAAASDSVTLASTGATSVFVGTTRDSFDGRVVTRLEYEAFVPMAARELQRVCDEARAAHPALANIAVWHRLGEVPVRGASVVIAVSSPHRADSLAALTLLIDTLKARVPIWKKEWYADDTGAWKANSECAGCAAGGASAAAAAPPSPPA